MKEIQVDMFEVQLGAAMLLQFKRDVGDWVSVLADAGIDASGYPLDHVRDKLRQPGTLQSETPNGFRIDLMIGTHYDKDHLVGLIPIIEDRAFDIGEAWLPPVANDTQLHAFDDAPDETKLLAFQFADEEGEARLARYLRKKDKICREASALIEMSFAKAEGDEGAELRIEERLEAVELVRKLTDNVGVDEEWFTDYLKQADEIIGDETLSHVGAELDVMEDEDALRFKYDEDYGAWHWHGNVNFSKYDEQLKFFNYRWEQDSELLKRDRYSLAYIQRSAAKDAINASSLYKVVKVLKQRGIPIRCRIIEDGMPQHYNWHPSRRRFVRSTKKSVVEPTLALLGPSQGLVQKHWHRLPQGDYLAKMALYALPIKSITPSNQLSYVARFEYAKQGILVTGDAGFVDFSRKRGKYYKALLKGLMPLHVVQVAHHGGRNAHFYRVLLKAGYAEQADRSFLLLSHKTNDRYRPSDVFAGFIEQVREEGDDVSLLFTSQPKKEKVRDYEELIHPVIPAVAAASEGDVRISYTHHKRWNVEKHSVSMP
jgi:hypothetical protein